MRALTEKQHATLRLVVDQVRPVRPASGRDGQTFTALERRRLIERFGSCYQPTAEGRALAMRLERLGQLERNPRSEFCCAECGATDAQSYVVTTLDYAHPAETRTEVCLECHQIVSALEPD